MHVYEYYKMASRTGVCVADKNDHMYGLRQRCRAVCAYKVGMANAGPQTNSNNRWHVVFKPNIKSCKLEKFRRQKVIAVTHREAMLHIDYTLCIVW